MGHITAITEDPTTGILWVAGFKMSNIPEYVNLDEEPFYQPYVAKVSSLGIVINVMPLIDNNPKNDLALPLSIQWTGNTIGNPCESADINGNKSVGFEDLWILAQAWLSTPIDNNWNNQCDLSRPTNKIDFLDFAVFSRNWLKHGCW
jgi:hypothetical protein